MPEVLYRIVQVYPPQLAHMQVHWVVKLWLCWTIILTYNSPWWESISLLYMVELACRFSTWSQEKTAIIN